ncbi:hypothetical protein ACJX0J_038949, partial [Zea mays]
FAAQNVFNLVSWLKIHFSFVKVAASISLISFSNNFVLSPIFLCREHEEINNRRQKRKKENIFFR